MLYERIEPSVLGDNVKIGIRFIRSQLTKVIGYEKVEGVGSTPRQAYILSVCSHSLKCSGSFKSYLCLVRPDENYDPDMLMLESVDVVRLQVFVINEHVVRFHVSSLSFGETWHAGSVR
jgi:hypothetical protein